METLKRKLLRHSLWGLVLASVLTAGYVLASYLTPSARAVSDAQVVVTIDPIGS